MEATPHVFAPGTDFALFNPLPILRDEDGGYHCPVPLIAREYDADGDDYSLLKRMCGEELRVDWRLSCSLPNDGLMLRTEDAPGWAMWSMWELKCCNGHVLLTSADFDGREDPVPFETRFAFGAVDQHGGFVS